MGLTEADFTVTSENYSNIKVVVVDGYLDITPITDEYVITVTGFNDKKVYNGTEWSVNGYEYSEYDSTITITAEPGQTGEKATAKGTLVGVYTMAMTEADFAATSPNFTNIKFNVIPGTLTITDGTEPGDDPIPDDMVVSKTVGDAKYALGTEITFEITATNIYNEARTITFTEIEGVTLAQSVFENVPAGETVTTTATYTVTEADVLAGTFTNTVTAKVGELEKEASATANIGDPNGHITITKETTSTPANGEAYVLGEKITYKITVTNDGNLTITNIEVTDALTGERTSSTAKL